MPQRHKIVSHEQWLAARKRFLRKEKAFTRLRDRLSAERRGLPWERIEKEYVFDGPDGKETLAELFGGRRQLLVYHFMFLPGTPGARTARSGQFRRQHRASRSPRRHNGSRLPRAVP